MVPEPASPGQKKSPPLLLARPHPLVPSRDPMDIVTLCPFRVSTLVFGIASSGWHLSVCVKGTFNLVHGSEATVATQQDSAHGDIYWDHDPQASLYTPSDFIPYKTRVDILLSGHAFAPYGTPTESMFARLAVGRFSKVLRLTGERSWVRTAEGLRPSPIKPFVSIPLRHELALKQGENKIGIDMNKGEVREGYALPRIATIDADSTSTPGFGPLAPRLRALRHQLSPSSLLWIQRLRFGAEVAPGGFDFDFFNAAPRDQQIEKLELGSTITLENIMPRTPVFETRLPKRWPKAFYVDPMSRRPVDVPMRCDTVWIDTNRNSVVVTWRGVTSVHSSDEAALGKLVVTAESLGRQTRYEDLTQIPQVPMNIDEAEDPVLPVPLSTSMIDYPTHTSTSFSVPMGEAPNRPPSSQSMRSAPRSSRGSALGNSRPRSLSDLPLAEATYPLTGSVVAFRSAPSVPEIARAYRSPSTPPPRPRMTPEDDESSAIDAPTTQRTGEGRKESRASTQEVAPPPQARPRPAWLSELLAPGALRSSGSSSPAPLATPPRSRESVSPGGSSKRPSSPEASSAARQEAPPDSSAPSTLDPPDLPALSPPARTPMSQRTPTLPPLMPLRATTAASAEASTETSEAKKEEKLPATLRPPPAQEVAQASVPAAPPLSQDLAPDLASLRVQVELCARVAAELGRRPHARAEILEQYGLHEESWTAVQAHWNTEIRSQLRQGRKALLSAYDAAYIGQIERERGPILVEEYARLAVGRERDELLSVLEALALPRGALMRLERLWLPRLASDPVFAARVRRAVDAARKAL